MGRAELLLAGSMAAEVQAIHPGVPEVNGVEVAAPQRGQGIGRALLIAAARAALKRGHGQIGIGVSPDNEPALRLYEQLGFRGSIPYLDRYSIMNEDGHPHDSADACIFLTANSETVTSARRPAARP